MKIGDVSGEFSVNRENSASGIIFMDLAVLFGVFNQVLKCPECGDNMTSHVDLKKKHGFAHHTVLQCDSLEYEWKYCFSSSQKQGPSSYEVKVRTVLSFKEIGLGHKTMVTFTKS